MKYFLSGGIIAIALNLYLIYRTLKAKKQHYQLLVGMLISAAVVTVGYLLSIMSKSYFANSFFSSVYFAGIDLMLFFVYHFAAVLATKYYNKAQRIVTGLLGVWVIVDAVTMWINPFWEIAISYEKYDGPGAPWIYEAGFLFEMHLVLSYCLVAISVGYLIYKTVKSPGAYRSRYSTLLAGVLVVVAVNAIYLFLPNKHLYDYSIFLYSVFSAIIVWNNNYYAERGMLNDAREMVLGELSSALLMFDYENRFVMANKAAKTLFADVEFSNKLHLEDMLDKIGVDSNAAELRDGHSQQLNLYFEGRERFYRMDYTVMKDNKQRIIGSVIMLSDYSLEYDLLTGFQTELVFRQNAPKLQETIEYPVGVAVFDINHLAEINRVLGKEFGDHAIKYLADSIQKHADENSRFIRLNEANLLLLTPGTTLGEMRKNVAGIYEELTKLDGLDGKAVEMQSAISMAGAENPDLLQAVSAALKSMRAKKLMDASSAHSSLLDSLAQTLQESDSCTREHVSRTQIMGEKLGIRLGLSDVELSNLALLCLLHDIGKLGIPLEILNKPGKLTDAEWEIMRSHAEKGYRIAKASKELEEIADLILHHHECWNGKGYPDGLKQEAIPLLSRIIAVVDTYDAMTNDRPYRQAMSTGEACKELMRCAGTQFDPFVVAEFIELLRENEMVAEQELSSPGEPKRTVKPMGLDDGSEQSNREIFTILYTKYMLDASGTIAAIDENFEKMTGYSWEDVKNYNLTQFDLIYTEDLTEYRKMVRKQLNEAHEAHIEHRLRRKDGTGMYVYCHGREYFDSVTREPRTQIIATDINNSASVRAIVDRERESARRSMKRWEESVRLDPLTGVLNRIAFQNDAQMKQLDESVDVVMIMMDVDFFKTINDTLGHQRGDEVLIAVAKSLNRCVGENGIAARMGGDEFGALLLFAPGTDKAVMESAVAAVWRAVTADVRVFNPDYSISMGAAVATEDQRSFNTLYKQADAALYEAKENGRDRYVFM